MGKTIGTQHIALFVFALFFLAAFFFETIVNFLYLSQEDDETDDWSTWAKIYRYNNSNAELSLLPKGTNQVVFFGDSITDLWNLSSYFPGKPYVNRGIFAQTTPQMLVRFRSDVLDLQPNIVVFLAGTNDIAGLTGFESNTIIEGNLATMVELCNAHNVIPIIASVLPVCGKYAISRSPARILDLNSWIKKYCEENGYIYVDYFSSLVGSDGLLIKSLSGDCLHPIDAGYKIMAPLVEAAIEKAQQSIP